MKKSDLLNRDERCRVLIRKCIKEGIFNSNACKARSYGYLNTAGQFSFNSLHPCYAGLSGYGDKQPMLALFDNVCRTGAFGKDKRLEYITALLSEEAPFWTNWTKLNPPFELEVDGDIYHINSPEFVHKHGLITYNTEETNIHVAMILMGYLRYLTEYPASVKSFFALREKGMPLRAAILLGQQTTDFSKTGALLPTYYGPDAHNAITTNRRDFKYDMANDYECEDNQVNMIVNGFYDGVRSTKIKGHNPTLDLSYGNIAWRKYFLDILNNTSIQDMQRYGKFHKQNITKNTKFFEYIQAKVHDVTDPNVVTESNRDTFVFEFNDLAQWFTDVIKKEFYDEEENNAVSSGESTDAAVA